jgi:hypothetical protein
MGEELIRDATARSIDGRTFRGTVPVTASVRPGDVVVLSAGGVRQAGLVHDAVETRNGDRVDVGGAVLGQLGGDGIVDRRTRLPAAAASIAMAGAELLDAIRDAVGATLEIGTWSASGHETVARLRGQAFNRHTFLCGQSGSGKTYALGVVLERLLLETDLRMIVFDPNGDFLRLDDARANLPDDVAARLGSLDVRVLRPGGPVPLRMRFVALDRRDQAAALQLDPLADREEYAAFVELLGARDGGGLHGLEDVLARLRNGDAVERALAQRLVNLGLTQWRVFAEGDRSAAEIIDDGSRATVLDLGGFGDPAEPLAVSLDVLTSLWRRREERVPTLLVVDEAHNLCPDRPTGPLSAALTDVLVRIAAEGRKFGLWLFLSTQRPSKIHPQVLSQCDNLLLMRMNSPGDVAELREVFGFAPPAMLGAAPYFAQGEALAAGPFVPLPSFVRMGARWTPESGADVGVPMPGRR